MIEEITGKKDMPIVIMPKQSKMDKMGGGGSDIGRTTPKSSSICYNQE